MINERLVLTYDERKSLCNELLHPNVDYVERLDRFLESMDVEEIDYVDNDSDNLLIGKFIDEVKDSFKLNGCFNGNLDLDCNNMYLLAA